MENLIILPTAMQLCLDDVAWHNGYDGRTGGRPSRSGLPRKHAPEDFLIVNEVGKAIDMKILCPLCLGEWDKDNLLRGEVGITYNPQNWNRAAEIDYDLAEAYLKAAEESEYLEYAVHGLLHGNYDENGKQLNEQEYFVRKKIDGEFIRVPISIDDLKRRLDIFEKIYSSWGFKKKIRTIVSPGGIPPHIPFDELKDFAEEFYRRGYIYWTNGWFQLEEPSQILNGVLCMRESSSASEYAPWNAYDYDPAMLYDFASDRAPQKRSVFGMHWTNFLRFNPSRNMEYLPDWIAYFKRQSEIFGVMLSKDIAFSANQLLYCQNAKLTFEEHKCIIDLKDVMKQDFVERKNEFYISFKNQLRPKEAIGGTMELYETHRNFRTYKIVHDKDMVQITF